MTRRTVAATRASAVLAGALAAALAIVALAAAQDRIVSAMAVVPAAELVTRCARGPCTTRWSGTSPSGLIRAEVVSREDTADRSTSLVLLVERGGVHFEHSLGESGRFCGGDSEGSEMTSWVASELVDFHGGSEPEIFVDTHVMVIGEGGSASQYGTVACSLEARRPSCHDYVGGERRVEPRTFPARGRIAIGTNEFAIPFLL